MIPSGYAAISVERLKQAIEQGSRSLTDDHLVSLKSAVYWVKFVDDILVSDTRIAYILHVRVKLGTRHLEVGYQLLARVEDGLVVEVWTSPLDPTALTTLWS